MSKNIIHAEWIGKNIRVTKATNKSLEKIDGKVVDETKFTITIGTKFGNKRIQKSGTEFEIDGKIVQGDKVLSAPEERIKLKVK